MADFPMEPTLAKMLIASVDLGCSDEILSIISVLSVQNILFYHPKEKHDQADSKKAKVSSARRRPSPATDRHNGSKASQFLNLWCHMNFIHSILHERSRYWENEQAGFLPTVVGTRK